MPLIVCPDCQKQVSDTSPSCIHCGYVFFRQKTVNRQSNATDVRLQANQKYALPAILSMILPGLGQLLKGHVWKALDIYSNAFFNIIGLFIVNYILNAIGLIDGKGSDLLAIVSVVAVCVYMWFVGVFDAYNSNSKKGIRGTLGAWLLVADAQKAYETQKGRLRQLNANLKVVRQKKGTSKVEEQKILIEQERQLIQAIDSTKETLKTIEETLRI